MTLARRLLTATFAIAILLSTVLFTANVFSQEGQETGSGLSISPTRTELRVEPGGTDVVKLSLRNVTNNNIVAKPIVNDFESDNESGQPKLLLQEKKDIPSIRPFLKELEDIPLQKGESKSFEIPVELPDDVAPGGYYGIVRYVAVPEGAPDPDEGQVSLTASVSSIILIEVPGDIREQIQLNDVLFYRKGIAGTFFSTKPEEIGIKIVNQGNGFSKPFGNVTVSNPLGKQTHSYEMNDFDPRSNVLPSSTRVFKDKVAGVSVPGRYSVTANISFGNGGEVLTLRKSFWYLPGWFILVVLLLVILVGAAVFWLRKKFAGGVNFGKRFKR